MYRILFLDDQRHRIADFLRRFPGAVAVEYSQHAIAQISNGAYFDLVFLDHDLHLPDTGMKVVEWVRENLPPVGAFFVHSTNVPASVRMIEELRKAGYFVRYLPYRDYGGWPNL